MPIWDKIAGGVSDLINIGGNLIGQKYGSDLQGHENDRMREYNLNMAREMFDRNVAENRRVWDEQTNYDMRVRGLDIARENEVFGMNKALQEEFFQKNIDRADTVWEREKAYNEELWAKQNEYNSPAAQMQRLKEAGLNPNLMYGQGTTGIAVPIRGADIGRSELGSVSAQGSRVNKSELVPARYEAPTYGSPVSKGENFLRGISNYIQIRNANLFAQNLEKQAKLIESNVKKVDEMTDYIRENKSKVGFEKERIKQETRAALRENELLEHTGASKLDPFFARFGGRVARWLMNRSNVEDDYSTGFRIQLDPMFQWER